jgi:hypothetical protein
MTTTTTTIWMARCRDCGLEQRRKSDPRRRTDAHNDLFCHDCVHPIEWQRYEVSEERGWVAEVIEHPSQRTRLNVNADPVMVAPLLPRDRAEYACASWIERRGWGKANARHVVRRTLRRVG